MCFCRFQNRTSVITGRMSSHILRYKPAYDLRDLYFDSKFLANLQFITKDKIINKYNYLSSLIILYSVTLTMKLPTPQCAFRNKYQIHQKFFIIICKNRVYLNSYQLFLIELLVESHSVLVIK